MTSTAPRRRASGTNRAPSRLKPGTATKAKPGSTRRESQVTPLTPVPPGGNSTPKIRDNCVRFRKTTPLSVARVAARTLRYVRDTPARTDLCKTPARLRTNQKLQIILINFIKYLLRTLVSPGPYVTLRKLFHGKVHKALVNGRAGGLLAARP